MNTQNKNQSLIDQQNSDKRTLDDLTSNNKDDKKIKYITEKLIKYNWATYPHRCLLVLDDFANHPLIRSKETEMCRLLKKLRHFNITLSFAFKQSNQFRKILNEH